MNTKTKTEVDFIYSTSVNIGTSTNVDGYVLFDNGNVNKPGIRYNSETSKLQYSDDGITWVDFTV